MNNKKRYKREGPQSPVGRGWWGGALLQAGLEPANYVTTADREPLYHTASHTIFVGGNIQN